MKLTQQLSLMEYPGRGIVLGMMGDRSVGVYFVTVRSAPSRAKKYVLSGDLKTISVQTTNLKIMARGKLDLLQYTSVRVGDQGFVIGNGRQVDAVELALEGVAQDRLTTDLNGWSYEDDAYHTPRITGLFTLSGGAASGALHIIRSNEIGTAGRNVYDVPLIAGQGQLITTYRGENTRPTPAFQGAPIQVEFTESSLESLVQSVYGALAPKEGKEDLRLSVMGVAYDPTTKTHETHILNVPAVA